MCVVLLCGTCDLPAKACVCNTVQFNGAFGDRAEKRLRMSSIRAGKTIATYK